jgi:hypothetical protein
MKTEYQMQAHKILRGDNSINSFLLLNYPETRFYSEPIRGPFFIIKDVFTITKVYVKRRLNNNNNNTYSFSKYYYFVIDAFR